MKVNAIIYSLLSNLFIFLARVYSFLSIKCYDLSIYLTQKNRDMLVNSVLIDKIKKS